MSGAFPQRRLGSIVPPFGAGGLERVRQLGARARLYQAGTDCAEHDQAIQVDTPLVAVVCMTEAARSTDHFSKSMFVIEVEGRPTAVFETKWHVDAELICRTWTNNHSEQLLVEAGGNQFWPIIKLRLARPDEIGTMPPKTRNPSCKTGRASSI